MGQQDNLIPVKDFLKNIDTNKLMQTAKIQFDIVKPEMPKASEVLIRPNPIYETNKILEEQNEKIDELSDKLENANLEISKQTKELQSIHYENMKLNAQIDVLNKTIDSQNDELERLNNINTELKIANKSLEESNQSNKHYWRNTILISLCVGVFSFILGLFATEAKALLQEILIILQ